MVPTENEWAVAETRLFERLSITPAPRPRRVARRSEGKMTDLIEGTLEKARAAIATHDLVAPDAAVLLMVSGGSDSTALAYRRCPARGGMWTGGHAARNHQLRRGRRCRRALRGGFGRGAGHPLFICSIDIAAEAERSRENVEAVARRERTWPPTRALRSMCQHEGRPLSEARIFTAHTADDRIENFYMRSIVGNRSGRLPQHALPQRAVVRLLLDLTRDELRDYPSAREQLGETVFA